MLDLENAEFDCRACGACCRPEDDSSTFYTYMRSEEQTKLTPRQRLQIYDEQIRTKCSRNNGGLTICVFLRGEIGEHVTCEIYKKRPIVCVEYEPGSDDCLNMRRELGVGLENEL